MNDDQFAGALQHAQARIEEGRAPTFDDAFAAAERRVRGARRRRMAGAIAAAIVAVAVIMQVVPPSQPEWRFVDPEQFASGTSWTAPSDVLLPERRFDIFEEVPVLIESTETDGGALL